MNLQNKKPIFILLIILLVCNTTMHAQLIYKRISINTASISEKSLMALGLDIDHARANAQGNIEFVADEHDLQILNNNFVSYKIIHDNEEKFYADRLKEGMKISKKTRSANCIGKQAPTYVTPSMFGYGSMGGYLTYAEAIAKLDSLAVMYPNILKPKAPIDTFKTVENRSIFWYKISDNPNTDEGEPEIMFNALHHAREAITLAQLIYFMAYLCENYATNSEIKYLVDNTEMYFVPILNPDGYVYNETTNPTGGGMWRKNRKLVAPNTYGVDLNRNYSTGWGFNNIGSSITPSSATYRGTSAASEPEVKAVQWLCNNHQFQIVHSNHSYGGDWIYPWGYLEKNTNDSIFFRAIATEINKFSYYKYGIDQETVGYSTNGSSDDWLYDSTAGHSKIYAGTPEIGDVADGFWPAQSRILPLCQEMNYFNITSVKLLLPYAITTYEGDRFLNNTNTQIDYSITKLGLLPNANYTVSIVPISANINSVGAPKIYSALQLANKQYDNIAINLANNTPNNSIVQCAVQCDNGIDKINDTLNLVYGNKQILFVDSCNNLNNWTTTNWGIGSGGYKSPNALMDSPNGFYLPNVNNSMVTSIPVSLLNVKSAELQYQVKWALENNNDLVNVYIISNGNTNQICARYTQPYIDFSNSLSSAEAYNSINTIWVKESINLDAYIGTNVQVAFEISTDAGLQMDGIAIDDVTIADIGMAPLQVANTLENKNTFYPNPSNGILYFNVPIKHLLVYGIDGKLIYENNALQSNFDLSFLQKGMYNIKYKNANDKIVNSKLVMQ